jgi:nucleotide-binding universal stress UspA family protein
MKIKKILFPTDFSRCSEQALAHAVFLAEKYNSEIHVLHVITQYADQPAAVVKEIKETEVSIRKFEIVAEKKLNKLIGSQKNKGLKIIKHCMRGISAATTILDYSVDKNIQLIVMGTHGRRGIEHFLLGSTAEEVVRMAHCPVFTIREMKRLKPVKKVNNILVPIDFSEYSRKALVYASEIAKSYDARLQVLHVIEETMHPALSMWGDLSIYDLVPDIINECRNRTEKMLKEVVPAKIKFNIYVQVGHTASDIIEFSKENSTNLIVIATHGLTGLEHMLLGSITEKVVRMAPCPVFTVKAFGKNLL